MGRILELAKRFFESNTVGSMFGERGEETYPWESDCGPA